jgi:hypothetical protein
VIAPFVLALSALALVDDEAPRGDVPPPPEATEDSAPPEPAVDGDDASASDGVAPEPAPPPPSPPATAKKPRAPAVDVDDKGPASSTPWVHGFWTGGVHIGALLAPLPTVGLTLGAGVGGPWWSVRVEGSADIADFEELAVTTTPVGIAAAPCLHVHFPDDDGGVSACATGTAALVPVSGRFEGVGPYVGAGGRIGLEGRDAHDGGAARLFLQAEAPIVGFRLRGDGEVFTSPYANFVLGLAFDIPAK